MSAIVCLMGPTASGKTPLAIKLVECFPFEIISVDSVMVYRGMTIGSAKPTVDQLRVAPHHLIDIADPKEAYSAGQFRQDALALIADIIARDRIPLLVGGTMLYFHVLQQGIAPLPPADVKQRLLLQEQANQLGWVALHAQLALVDPLSAARIHVHDSQRIQRALEVYQLTGKPLSTWLGDTRSPLESYQVCNLLLAPNDRAPLHERIAKRFDAMLTQGLLPEVEALYHRGDLSAHLPAIRAVGYAQVWAYLAGQLTYTEMREQALAATRQLAKRQLTWLRRWPAPHWFDSEAPGAFEQVLACLGDKIKGIG